MTPNQNRFIVMGQKGLVLRDLTEIMRERFADLEPAAVCTVADTLALLDDGSHWRYAFLTMGPNDLANSDLAAALARLGTKVVLLGNDAEDAGADCPYPVLVRPYGADDVLAVLGAVV